MTKADLIEEVAATTSLTKEQATEAVEAQMRTIKRALTGGESVYLRGFGTFEPKQRAQKLARNINTGAQVVVPARQVPHFKPAAEFKEQLAALSV